MRIVLPFPSRKLSPNFHAHWRVKEQARKEAIDAGFCAARTVYTPGTDAPLTGDLRVTYHFYPPDRRSRDDDNIIASLKHARDSIAKALEVDDKQFRMQAPVWHEPVPGGKIEVEIEEL